MDWYPEVLEDGQTEWRADGADGCLWAVAHIGNGIWQIFRDFEDEINGQVFKIEGLEDAQRECERLEMSNKDASL